LEETHTVLALRCLNSHLGQNSFCSFELLFLRLKFRLFRGQRFRFHRLFLLRLFTFLQLPWSNQALCLLSHLRRLIKSQPHRRPFQSFCINLLLKFLSFHEIAVFSSSLLTFLHFLVSLYLQSTYPCRLLQDLTRLRLHQGLTLLLSDRLRFTFRKFI